MRSFKYEKVRDIQIIEYCFTIGTVFELAWAGRKNYKSFNSAYGNTYSKAILRTVLHSDTVSFVSVQL